MKYTKGVKLGHKLVSSQRGNEEPYEDDIYGYKQDPTHTTVRSH